MVVKAATKKRLMDLGVPESVAHRLAKDRPMEKVRELQIYQIADIAYDYLNTVGKLPTVDAHILDQSRIIFYLIDPFNRNFPQGYSTASFGVLNWWWGEDSKRSSPLIEQFNSYHQMTIAELKELLRASRTYTAGKKSAMVARLMKEELE